MSGDGLLRLQSLSKAFGSERVLNGLDLTVEEGSILSVLGPSGCGKSTTLRIIAGLVRQDAGRVLMDGKCIDRIPVHKRNIGFVFQNYSLFPHLDLRRNIEFGMRLKGWKEAVIKQEGRKLIELVGLAGQEKKRPPQLSGGQQQRVALARALAIKPRLLLLDEPFGALDANIRRRIRQDLKALQKRLGVTMVFVTHDQEEAFEVGDRTAVMNRGRIEQVGLPRDLYDHPASLFVAKFVGNNNVIKVPACEGEPEAEVVVRPEDVRLLPDRGNGGIKGQLVNYVFLGPYIEVQVELDNGSRLISLMPKSEFISQGFRRGHRMCVKIKRFKTFANGVTRRKGRTGV